MQDTINGLGLQLGWSLKLINLRKNYNLRKITQPFFYINHATSSNLYRSYYPHRSKELVSPVYGIFLFDFYVLPFTFYFLAFTFDILPLIFYLLSFYILCFTFLCFTHNIYPSCFILHLHLHL